jgi:hypothetical protein
MRHTFRFGAKIYYVPKFDDRLARYVPITSLRLALKPPILILEHHLVISPKLGKNGNIARDRVGSYWISKEAYEASRAPGALWRRISNYLEFPLRTEARSIVDRIFSPARDLLRR